MGEGGGGGGQTKLKTSGKQREHPGTRNIWEQKFPERREREHLGTPRSLGRRERNTTGTPRSHPAGNGTPVPVPVPCSTKREHPTLDPSPCRHPAMGVELLLMILFDGSVGAAAKLQKSLNDHKWREKVVTVLCDPPNPGGYSDSQKRRGVAVCKKAATRIHSV